MRFAQLPQHSASQDAAVIITAPKRNQRQHPQRSPRQPLRPQPLLLQAFRTVPTIKTPAAHKTARQSTNRSRRRNEELRPILNDFFDWLLTVNPVSSSGLAKAVQYALNEKRYLYGFLDDPGIEISNNRAENAIRPFVVGRKNWLFSDSPKGAEASAVLYSLVVSAKMNGLNAEDYRIILSGYSVPLILSCLMKKT